jgi:hypothetical protein
MPFVEALRLAIDAIRQAKLRSFFTLLGIIVSVGFLVTVVAVIQGMNAYVKENITDAMIGTNSFQVRRLPLSLGLSNDDQIREMQKRPLLTHEDAEYVARVLPDAQAVSLQSGWPTPVADVTHRNTTVGSVAIFGVTPAYQTVQDYRFIAGEPLSEPDINERRFVVVLGYDIAEKALQRCRSWHRPDDPGRANRIQGEGHHRQEGPGARAVVRFLRTAPDLHIRVALGPAEDHDGLGEDGAERGAPGGDGPRRGGDAAGASLAARRTQ